MVMMVMMVTTTTISRDSVDPLNKYGRLPSTGVQSKPESIKFIQIEKAFSNTQTNEEMQIEYWGQLNKHILYAPHI